MDEQYVDEGLVLSFLMVNLVEDTGVLQVDQEVDLFIQMIDVMNVEIVDIMLEIVDAMDEEVEVDDEGK